MKKILLLVSITIYLPVLACSGIQKSFCYVKSTRLADNVICGVILAKVSHSVQMAIIDLLSGVENRSVITIWDGTDINCNGIVSMSASDLGSVGDTLIAVLPLINSVSQNTWDVTGDYRRPYSLYETAWLKVTRDTVWGYISGAPNTPLLKYSYAAFKGYWLSHGNDCQTLSVTEIANETININVSDGYIQVVSPLKSSSIIKLYDVGGRLVLESKDESKHKINVSCLPHGMYLLSVQTNAAMQPPRKLIL